MVQFFSVMFEVQTPVYGVPSLLAAVAVFLTKNAVENSVLDAPGRKVIFSKLTLNSVAPLLAFTSRIEPLWLVFSTILPF